MTTDTVPRPSGHISYAEAEEATGLSRRHLRRLVADGTLDAMDAGGRRWVTTASLVSAGYRLNPSGPGPETVATEGTETPDMAEEVERLRRQLAVAEALAAERLREIERLGELTHRTLALLPANGGTPAPDTAGGRWWRRKRT